MEAAGLWLADNKSFDYFERLASRIRISLPLRARARTMVSGSEKILAGPAIIEGPPRARFLGPGRTKWLLPFPMPIPFP